jgi:DNA-binding transcriptional regulator YhcF (GntR family)
MAQPFLAVRALLRYSAVVPSQRPALPSLSAEAALSFLKDTKGTLTWSIRDLADTLKISRAEAQQALALLQAQGYVQPAHQKGVARSAGQWITTSADETVSGAKPPRFARESVEQALAVLKDRIKQSNKNPQAPFRITGAVAFGDFLFPDRARVQSADVGVSLVRRGTSSSESRSASDAQVERRFLRDLRARSALLTIRPCADWMRHRSHRDLL